MRDAEYCPVLKADFFGLSRLVPCRQPNPRGESRLHAAAQRVEAERFGSQPNSSLGRSLGIVVQGNLGNWIVLALPIPWNLRDLPPSSTLEQLERQVLKHALDV